MSDRVAWVVAGRLEDEVQRRERMLEAACRLHTDFIIGRYLMANAHGRWNGAEKAVRHRDLCSFYVAVFHQYDDAERAARERRSDYEAVHKATQRLTDNLDQEIGFPLDGPPDYHKLVPAFFKRFHSLAMQALRDSEREEERA